MEKKFWQIIPVLGFVFCVILVFINFFYPNNIDISRQFSTTVSIITLNLITGFAFLYLIYKPERLVLYAFIFLVNGFLNILDGGNVIGGMMLYLSFNIAFRLNFFQKNYVLKITLFFVILVIGVMFQLRFGLTIFLCSFLYIGVLLLMFLFQFFIMYQYFSDLMPRKRKKVRLIDFNLQERDYDLIRRVLNDDKYSSTALHFEVSESAIKQRMRQIYRIFNVRDRNAFLLYCNNIDLIFPSMPSKNFRS